MANNINKVIVGGVTKIDLTGDTVTEGTLLAGYTAHDKSGAGITGSCTYNADTSDATATSGEILYGRTAYVDGSKITGNMVNNGRISGTISTKSGQYTVQKGYHDGSGTVQISSTEQAKIIPGYIKSGISILGVTGTYSARDEISVTETLDSVSGGYTLTVSY